MVSSPTPADLEADSYQGPCHVCGRHAVFVRAHRSLREGYACEHCRASLRYRGQARVLVELYGSDGVTCLAELARDAGFAALDIFEPGVSGPYRKYLRDLPRYVQSFYWPDFEPGEERDGIRCENLEDLTFADASLDLIITSDIMEHVRHPWRAFEDMFRVLKPGGRHVFSIPVQKPLRAQSRDRVDVSGPDDIHLEEPHYHGDGAGGRSLVYIDYGLDLVQRLTDMDYAVTVMSPDDRCLEARRLVTFATHKPRNTSNHEA